VQSSPQNVIGGEVNPLHPLLQDNPGEIAKTVDMDLKGELGFMLCIINHGVGRSADGHGHMTLPAHLPGEAGGMGCPDQGPAVIFSP